MLSIWKLVRWREFVAADLKFETLQDKKKCQNMSFISNIEAGTWVAGAASLCVKESFFLDCKVWVLMRELPVQLPAKICNNFSVESHYIYTFFGTIDDLKRECTLMKTLEWVFLCLFFFLASVMRTNSVKHLLEQYGEDQQVGMVTCKSQLPLRWYHHQVQDHC